MAEGMAIGSAVTANAIFLLVTLPFLLDLWFEAVLLRIQRGPQMLLFSLSHGGAGALTIPIGISLMAMILYWLFVLSILVASLIPSVRRRLHHARLILAGGAVTVAYVVFAGVLQMDLSAAVIYAGGLLQTLLLCSLLALAILSFRAQSRPASQG